MQCQRNFQVPSATLHQLMLMLYGSDTFLIKTLYPTLRHGSSAPWYLYWKRSSNLMEPWFSRTAVVPITGRSERRAVIVQQGAGGSGHRRQIALSQGHARGSERTHPCVRTKRCDYQKGGDRNRLYWFAHGSTLWFRMTKDYNPLVSNPRSSNRVSSREQSAGTAERARQARSEGHTSIYQDSNDHEAIHQHA